MQAPFPLAGSNKALNHTTAMTMKKNYIHTTCTFVLLGMMVAGLWGCQKDDLAEQASVSQGALQLTVIDGGYTISQVQNYEGGTLGELPQTRAIENGYQTTFTQDDQIGLYAVKSSALVATNVCLTLTNVSGTLQWQPPTGVKLPTDANYYFAYYPYKSSPGNVAATAITADAFFADVISAWTPATDQSGTNYTRQDLMVGSGTLANNQLTIILTHKMGLAVIKLFAGMKDIEFDGFSPYAGVTDEYRYLLKPGTETTLKGSFFNSGACQAYTIQANIAEGNYKTYTVAPPPQIGDYYYEDKTYSTAYDATRTCIGIVFAVNADGKSGKIVGVDEPIKDWNGGTNVAGKLIWSPNNLATNATNPENGLANMATIKVLDDSFTTYPAFAWVHAMNPSGTTYTATSTGVWYLPAEDELRSLYVVKAIVNLALSTASKTGLSDDYYLSSTEDGKSLMAIINLKSGTRTISTKNTPRLVRAVRAF